MNGPARDGGVPLGFGMALAQNTAAMDAFAALPENKKQEWVNGARKVRTKQEMQRYVAGITEMTAN